MLIRILFSLFCFFFISSGYAASLTKTYALTHLENVTNNHANCSATYQDLKQLSKHPIEFSFQAASAGGVQATEKNNRVMNHHYQIVKQDADQATVDRVGIGSFDLKNHAVQYVILVSANLNHTNYHYVYPMILSSEHGHCYYLALLKPTKETIESFKKHIKSGTASDQKDLTDPS